jgi:uncharacterized protein
MHTCLYEGWVWHRRHEPVEHRFRYALALLYIDLDELAEAFRGRWLWSSERANFASFRRADHLGDPQTPLIESVRELLAAEGLAAVRGPIRLLTQPRYVGFLINPVSFYFCFESDGQTLAAVVAEVTNTPWRERHCYVLRGDQLARHTGQPRSLVRKQMHVSPFMPMDVEYRWQLSAPGAGLRVRIQNLQEGRPTFDAVLQLARREWTTAALHRLLLRYPLMTQRVALGIYWQALWLWWRRCPVFPHPAPQPVST